MLTTSLVLSVTRDMSDALMEGFSMLKVVEAFTFGILLIVAVSELAYWLARMGG